MTEPKVFAEQLVERVNKLTGTYDDDLYMLLVIISEGDSSIKGSCPICTFDDFCQAVGFHVPMGRLKEFIVSTREAIVPIIQQELAKKPVSVVEAMIKVVYFSQFEVKFSGVYDLCKDIYSELPMSSDNNELALYIAKTFDKIREEM